MNTLHLDSGEYMLFWRKLQYVAKYALFVLFLFAKIFICAIFHAFSISEFLQTCCSRAICPPPRQDREEGSTGPVWGINSMMNYSTCPFLANYNLSLLFCIPLPDWQSSDCPFSPFSPAPNQTTPNHLTSVQLPHLLPLLPSP